jgi:hypothetical protein
MGYEYKGGWSRKKSENQVLIHIKTLILLIVFLKFGLFTDSSGKAVHREEK